MFVVINFGIQKQVITSYATTVSFFNFGRESVSMYVVYLYFLIVDQLDQVREREMLIARSRGNLKSSAALSQFTIESLRWFHYITESLKLFV